MGEVDRCKKEIDRMDEQGKMSTKLELMEPKNKSSIRKIPLNDLAFDILHTHYKRQLEQKTEWQEIYTDRNLVFAKMDGDFISPRGMLFDYYKLLEK